uniref:Uncharacterized protein n=1 Tax=Brassica oleracea TaxID=3712 RepID=A0A3P6BLS4_BRAOL|nr:unnamed protein product [Brassica oleracea]
MRFFADANKENILEVEEQKESEDKDKHKNDKEEKANKVYIVFLKPGEGENYYRGGGRGGRGRGVVGRDGEGAYGGGFDGYRSEVATAIGDIAQFPYLGASRIHP